MDLKSQVGLMRRLRAPKALLVDRGRKVLGHATFGFCLCKLQVCARFGPCAKFTAGPGASSSAGLPGPPPRPTAHGEGHSVASHAKRRGLGQRATRRPLHLGGSAEVPPSPGRSRYHSASGVTVIVTVRGSACGPLWPH